MNSYSIKSTFNELKKIGKENTIIPLDYRPLFLTRKSQNRLYGIGWKNYKIDDHELVKQIFVEPFFQKNFLFQTKYNYSSSIGLCLQNYYNNLLTSFKNIALQLDKKECLNKIRSVLKQQWAFVSDYFIILELCKSQDTYNEFIIIIGEAHRKNIQVVLNTFPNNVITQIGTLQKNKSNNNCVKLLKTSIVSNK